MAAHGDELVEHRGEERASFDHGAIHDLTQPRSLSFQEGTHDSEGGSHGSASEVAEQVQRGHRGLTRVPDQSECARQGDVVDVMSCPRAERPGLAPAGTASEDERTVSLSNDVGTEPEPLSNPRTKAFNEDVRTIEQIKELFKAGSGLDV